MPAIELVETPAPFTFVVSESLDGPFRSRDVATFGPNLTVLPGTVLGAIGTPASETVAAAADADNAGNGTITMDATAPLAASAKDGAYRVLFTSATAFVVSNPSGVEIGKGAVGTAFAKDVKFLIAAGGTAFAQNDAFTVAVVREAIRDELFVPLNPAATDGSQVARAIAGYKVITGAPGTAAVKATIFNGPGEVRLSDLIWPVGISQPAMLEALQDLRRVQIKAR